MRAGIWTALVAVLTLAPALEAQESRTVIPPGAAIARASRSARFAKDLRTVDTRVGRVRYTPVVGPLTRESLERGVVIGKVEGVSLSKLKWARGSGAYDVYLKGVSDDWQVAFEQGGEVVHTEAVGPATQTIIIVECLDPKEGGTRGRAPSLPVLDVLLPSLAWEGLEP